VPVYLALQAESLLTPFTGELVVEAATDLSVELVDVLGLMRSPRRLWSARSRSIAA